VTLALGNRPTQVLTGPSGRVLGVELTDGRAISADLVVFSIGITPRDELARAAGAEAVYAHGEVSRDECRAEENVSKAIEKEGVEVKYFWGSTLYHLDDLPFRLDDMPSNYGGFREAVKGLEVRKVLDAPEEVKCVPMKNVLEPGDIPTLGELGLSAPPAMAQVKKLKRRSFLLRHILSCSYLPSTTWY
jgi:hypothetical protein